MTHANAMPNGNAMPNANAIPIPTSVACVNCGRSRAKKRMLAAMHASVQSKHKMDIEQKAHQQQQINAKLSQSNRIHSTQPKNAHAQHHLQYQQRLAKQHLK